MTPNSGNLDQRVTRLENDVGAIYEMLGEIQTVQAAHTARFDGIDQHLGGIDQHLDGIDQHLDGIDQRLDGIDRRLDAHDARFDGIDRRLDAHDARFDTIDATLAEILRRLPAS